MEYRRGDVRDPEALRGAFEGADVVVHLAFMITGTASRQTIRAINVEGTLSAFAAAAEAGAERFVYASSVAAYGFHADNPIGMTEDWPVRPAARLFYAQEKAELERLLRRAGGGRIRASACICSGRRSCSGRTRWARRTSCRPPVAAAAQRLLGVAHRLARADSRPRAGPADAVHPRGRRRPGPAASACWPRGRRARTTSPATAWSTIADVVRELGLTPVPVPAALAARAARAAALIPPLAVRATGR